MLLCTVQQPGHIETENTNSEIDKKGQNCGYYRKLMGGAGYH